MGYQVGWWRAERDIRREQQRRWAEIDAAQLRADRLHTLAKFGLPVIAAIAAALLVAMWF